MHPGRSAQTSGVISTWQDCSVLFIVCLAYSIMSFQKLGTVFKLPWYYLAHNRYSTLFLNMEGRKEGGRKGERERGRKEGEEKRREEERKGGREGGKEGEREGCGCYNDGPWCFSLSDFLRQKKTNIIQAELDQFPPVQFLYIPFTHHPWHFPHLTNT